MNLFEALKNVGSQQTRPHLITVTIRVNPAVHEQLEMLSKKLEKSQNWVVSHLIQLAYEQMRKEKKP